MRKIPALIHREDTKFLSEINLFNHPLATLVYNKEKFILSQLNKIHDGYIILPGYISDETNQKLEVQLAVTGKVRKNETFKTCFQREIAEEIGFRIDSNLVLNKVYDKYNDICFSIISKKNIKYDDETVFKDGDDIYDKRIISWMYMRELDEDLIINRKRLPSDDIAGETIVILEVKHLRYILNCLLDKKVKKCSKYCFKLK